LQQRGGVALPGAGALGAHGTNSPTNPLELAGKGVVQMAPPDTPFTNVVQAPNTNRS